MHSLPGTKICRNCGIEKLKTEFHLKNLNLGYVQPECKECTKLIRNKPERKLNKDKTLLELYPDLTKRCPCCKLTKHVDEFSKHNKKYEMRNTYCKVCAKQKKDDTFEERQIKNKEYTDKNKYKVKNIRLQNKFGITLDDKKQLLISQNNKCKICGEELCMEKKPNSVSVDHNHNTGKIRGILCHKCNLGIGLFKDNPDFLYKALEYILENDFNIKDLIKLETYDS